VIGQQFCAPYPVQLTVQRRPFSFSGGDFNALDSAGNLLLTVEGRAFSRRSKRILRDQAGIPLLTIRKKLLSLHGTWEAYRGEGTGKHDLLFTVGMSKLFQSTTSLKVCLGSNSHTDFKVKGNFFLRTFTIYQGSTTIAEMRSKYKLSDVNVLWTDTFAITVYPGVDYAFAVALVVILDKISRRESRSRG
jgi:uncharacterized protein YxjI